MEIKIFKNELEIIYLKSFSNGFNNIKKLKNSLLCMSNETFAKITQSLYFKMIIDIKGNEIIISDKMKALVDYLISNKIEVIDKQDNNTRQNIIYHVKRINNLDVTKELIILLS